MFVMMLAEHKIVESREELKLVPAFKNRDYSLTGPEKIC